MAAAIIICQIPFILPVANLLTLENNTKLKKKESE
jgi:hypothetical protein